jgi:tetratricopeptide (TPR) repeat protein
MLKKITTTVILWLLIGVFCYGQSNLSKGEELLMHNKPAEALLFLENAVIDDPVNAKAYLYLGVVYEQLGKTDEAIAVYRRAQPIAGNLSANVANNLGNVYFKKGDTQTAEQFYTQAISFNSVYSRAYLGRANTQIKSGKLRNAAADYESYLSLEPNSPQRSNIERLVTTLRTEFAAEERRKFLAEEEERIRAEEMQKLLNDVSATLQSVVDSSRGISSGAESVEGYEGDFELE